VRRVESTPLRPHQAKISEVSERQLPARSVLRQRRSISRKPNSEGGRPASA